MVEGESMQNNNNLQYFGAGAVEQVLKSYFKPGYNLYSPTLFNKFGYHAQQNDVAHGMIRSTTYIHRL